jgi:putative ABC transport system substrate-binding protein
VRRREFITLLGGAATAWPIAAMGQPSNVPTIGFLTSLGENDRPNLRAAFRRGLSDAGYIEGHNVAIAYRFAEDRHDRLPALAEDLVRRKVALIAASGGGASVLAAKTATSTIPIVFAFGGDPVREGMVSSLNRPGGNITGTTFFAVAIGGKALGLLLDAVPNPAIIALMVNPRNPESAEWISSAQEAARTLGRQLVVLNASTTDQIAQVFVAMRERGVGALVAGGDPFFTARRRQIVAMAARDAIPAIYSNREYVADGGLMSYGNDIEDVYRRAGVYAGRVLKGENPSDLPVDQATRFEFVINLKTAAGLGLMLPPTLLARADEVIE